MKALLRKRKPHDNRLFKRLRFSPQGKLIFALSVIVGIAAVNTGNNLLYLLLGWTLSLIVASGILSERCLRHLEIKLMISGSPHALSPHTIRASVTNKKKWFSSYCLRIIPVVQGSASPGFLFFERIPPGETALSSFLYVFTSRGAHTIDHLYIQTMFPFGFFTKSRKLKITPAEIVVYPEITSVTSTPRRGLSTGRHPQNRLARAGDFHALREYRVGDDQRNIHWRSSARKDTLLVREYQDDTQRRIVVEVDNRSDPRMESVISHAASHVLQCSEQGLEVGLAARGVWQPPAPGPHHVHHMLSTLANLDANDEAVLETGHAFATIPLAPEQFSTLPHLEV